MQITIGEIAFLLIGMLVIGGFFGYNIHHPETIVRETTIYVDHGFQWYCPDGTKYTFTPPANVTREYPVYDPWLQELIGGYEVDNSTFVGSVMDGRRY